MQSGEKNSQFELILLFAIIEDDRAPIDLIRQT